MDKFAKIISAYWELLLQALGRTMLLALLAIAIAMVIGLIFGLMNVSRNRVLNLIGTVYVDAIRGVPLLVLTFFIYFGVPQAAKMMGFTNFRLEQIPAGIISLSLNCGAYMAEIVRAGIESVDKGQMEAGRSLGLSYGKTMTYIVVPQAIRTMIPSIINQFIITLKDTSIISVIGYAELTNMGKTISGNTLLMLHTWAIIGIMYLIVITILSKIAKKVERRVNRGR